MFIKDVFDYENTKEWKYKRHKLAADLYADWCGPCRMTAPIMKSLAKEYDGKIVIYKVNVDKEKELQQCNCPCIHPNEWRTTAFQVQIKPTVQ